MTAQAVERNNQPRPTTNTTLPTPWHDQAERMPLRTDLYLIAHDDDTGRPHLDKHAIAVGLAGAVLLELWYAGRVRLGWHGNPHHGTWQRNHTQATLLNATPTDDPIHDAAIGLLWRMGGTVNIKQFINQFATTDLYGAVRDHLVAQRILRRFYRRRFLFFRTEHHRPRLASHPVRARARIRDVARLVRPHIRDTILTALVVALNLTPYARLIDYSVSGLHIQLDEHIGPQHPIHDITKAIAPYRLRFQ
jgi:hypothetical protein